MRNLLYYLKKKGLIVENFVIEIKYNSHYESGSLKKIIFFYLKTDVGTTEKQGGLNNMGLTPFALTCNLFLLPLNNITY
jgi:hypothetical protein